MKKSKITGQFQINFGLLFICMGIWSITTRDVFNACYELFFGMVFIILGFIGKSRENKENERLKKISKQIEE